jgi:DNA-binding transcriptional LysR family regulator
MNLRQCEVFRSVMEAGTVTAAAERLHVTQPAVSKMLAQLERDLGFRAFLRDRRRLIPTPEARALYHEVERAFVSLDYLTRFARDLKGLRQGHIVVGATHAISVGWLPGLVAEFLQQHPGLSMSLETMDSPRIAHAVATGHLDLGIVQFEIATHHVKRETLFSVEAVCVMPPAHRLAKRRVIRPADLQDEPFIALSALNRFRVKLDALMEAEGIDRRIRINTPLGSSACAFVMEGMGVTVIDRLSAEDNRHRGIVIRPFQPQIAEGLVLLTPARRPVSMVADEFAAALRARFNTGKPKPASNKNSSKL